MSAMTEIDALLEATGHTVHPGYPSSTARAPFYVRRPILLDPSSVSLQGQAIDWDYQFGIYCAGDSVDASFALALEAVEALDGASVADTTLSVSVGYVGALIEGLYESQVTVQLNQGGIS